MLHVHTSPRSAFCKIPVPHTATLQKKKKKKKKKEQRSRRCPNWTMSSAKHFSARVSESSKQWRTSCVNNATRRSSKCDGLTYASNFAFREVFSHAARVGVATRPRKCEQTSIWIARKVDRWKFLLAQQYDRTPPFEFDVELDSTTFNAMRTPCPEILY